jgi:two-component sensor histidine kinase
MFPRIPETPMKRAFQLLGLSFTGQICILPLLIGDKVIGAMPIWGADLQPTDNPVLALFASQVAGILQNTLAYETETKRTNELARSNAMILSLAKVAAMLENRLNSSLILDTLGSEIQKLGLDCGIAVIDPAGEKATIKYLSFNSALLQKIEKTTGFSLNNHEIPKKYWPGDRILKEKVPIWYPNPRNFLRQLFPEVSDALRDRGFQLLGIPPGGQICIIPLLIGEKVIGALTIWGADLNQADDPILAIFASQVASILENASAYETESRRAEELARSNSIILALSKVAAQLESSSDSDVIFETVGTELKKMGLDSMVGVLDDSKQNLQIRYISANRDIIRRGEKMIGRQISELTIPRRLWPTQKVVDEKATDWDSMKSTLNIFPVIPESLHRTVLKMAGINLDDPVCYLPIATEHEVIGVLSVWGTELNKNDIPALSIIANQVAATIRNSRLYEMESRRARELDILLKASESTSSSLDLDIVLLKLASQLLDISGFESCFISELDKKTNLIHNRIDHSRVFWIKEKRDAYSLSDYPSTKKVLLTGKPIILQGDFEAEEKQWMKQLGRTAAIILPLYAQEKIIGLVEIATTKKNKLFSFEGLHECERIIANAAGSLIEPVSVNDPKTLFAIEKALLQSCGGDVCSFSEWDRPRNRVLTCAVYSDQIWKLGESPGIKPDRDSSWKLAIQEGVTSAWIHSEGNEKIEIIGDGTITIDIESLILFPLQKGEERIGLVELYDFNHKTQVSPEQLALLRTIADKASYWIENARLLQQTQQRLEEQTELLHEKEILLKEIHHRVKNNLQVISSLLSLQAGKVADEKTKQLMGESQARVRSMALIHEKLYQSESLAKINFGDYVKSLTGELFHSYRRGLNDIQLIVQVEEVALPLDQAVPCGLILNELITNAMKYAFPEGTNGTLWVELRTNPNRILSLRVADDGVGMASDFDYRKANSLGIQLVNSLVAQLDGQLELNRSAGTDFRILFKY